MKIPRILHKPLISLINKYYVIPLLNEDLWALDEEMNGHWRYPDRHHYEFNPIVSEFQKLSLEKWNEYVIDESERELSLKKSSINNYFIGAGLSVNELIRFRENVAVQEN